MPTYNLLTYQLPFGWLDPNGSDFVYSSATTPTEVLHVSETDGIGDDMLDDKAPSSNTDDYLTQIVQGDVFGFATDGLAVESAAVLRLTGDDGSTIKLYVILTADGTTVDQDDYIFVTDAPLVDGVEYTKVQAGFYASQGEMLYADLAQVAADGYVDGTAGDDVIDTSYTGDPDGDMVDNGDATLPGATGDDDYIRAGDGNDTVLAGAGDDIVEGGAGDDTLNGGDGNDTIHGGDGADVIDGGAGDDVVYGEADNDSITGGLGDDTVYGGTGNDTIVGGIGNDTLSGDDGDDVIYGDGLTPPSAGQTDFIVDGYFKGTNFTLTNGHFSNSASTVFDMDTEPTQIRFVDTDSDMDTDPTNEVLDPAESGLVEIDGVLYGYVADFTITYDGSDGNTYEFVVIDVDLNGSGAIGAQLVGNDNFFEDGQILLPVGTAPPVGITLTSPGIGIGVQVLPDSLDYTTLAGYTPATYDDTIDGGAGDDTIYGGLGDDIITGGSGADTISGDDGADTISGGIGNDLLNGNDGDDLVRGQAGNDTVLGGLGNDDVRGGTGNDAVYGEAGNDVVSGGGGDDIVDGGTGDDTLTGGAGDDIFVYQDGDGVDVITDFGTGESGPTDDGDQTNNDFVDLASFYNATTMDAVNNSDADASNDFTHAISMLRADQADGTLDGIIGGVDYSAQIGDIDLTIENSGSAVDADTLTHDNTNVVCFVKGTRIATQNGEIAIEDLAIGDKVMTVDRGYQPIRWIGSTTVPATGKRAPIVFAKGAIGNADELRVSPNHRVLLTGWQAGMLFGETEVLVAAKHLVNDTSVQRCVGGRVDYFHMLFDQHEIVFSEGARTESFHPGQQGWGALAEQTRAEILDLLPQLDPENFATYGQSARLSLKASEGELARDIGGFIQDVVALERQP